jgi:P27 family predicted phage terminase small subunit
VARGRPPEPLERKRAKARGDGTTPGKRPVPEAAYELVQAGAYPVPPEDLADRGLTEWHKIWSVGPWLSHEQDYPWVEMICRAWNDIEEFRAKVKADGLIQQGSMGQVIAHPLIGEIRKAEGVIQKCLSVIGFSPSDRARLALGEVKVKKELADLDELIQRQRDKQ